MLSNEQITLQSTHLSSTSVASQTIRNDSVGMDITKTESQQEKVVSFQPRARFSSIPAEEKENIAALDDMDLTLEFPLPAPTTKSFSMTAASKFIPAAFSKPNSSISMAKIPMAETSVRAAEKTGGSDNMDISGIEPADPYDAYPIATVTECESEYSKWLKTDNFSTKNQQKPANEIVDIELEESLTNALPAGRTKAEATSRTTINQPFEMSLEMKNQTECKDVSGSSADMSIEQQAKMNATNTIDMEMSHLKLTNAKQCDFDTNIFKKPNDRRTTHVSHDITIDDVNVSKPTYPNTHDRTCEISSLYQRKNEQPNDTGILSFVNPVGKAGKQASMHRTINELQDITTDEFNASKAIPHSRRADMSIKYAMAGLSETLSDTQRMEMSSKAMQADFAAKSVATSRVAEKGSARRQTMLQAHDMDLESPVKQSNDDMASSSKQNARKTINTPHNISVDVSDKRPMTIQLFQPMRRQTTHKVQDISLDTSLTAANVPAHSDAKQCALDISLDQIQSNNSPAVQHGNRNWKKGASSTASRLTINEPRDMSFDSNASGKSNTHSRYNKTILGDMSMELQSTDMYGQMHHKSDMCQSPSKNVPNAASDRSTLEFTKMLIDYNNLSSHPLHSTKLNDKNCSKFTNFELCSSGENSSDDEIERNKPKSTAAAPPPAAAQQFGSFELTESRTVHVACNLDMSDEENSPIPTAKKYNLNKTPYYAELDQENDSSSLELTASNFNSEYISEPKSNEKQSIASEPCRRTEIFHATIRDDNSHLNVLAEAQSMELSVASSNSIPLERAKAPKLSTGTRLSDHAKRLSVPNQSLFQLSSIGSPIQTSLNSNSSAPEAGLITNLANISIGANESSKQLTFIEDDDDEEQICNTKIDLASSLECSDNESATADMLGIIKPIISSTTAMLTSVDLSNQSLCEELNAFKKSSRLRHSNAFESSKRANANRSDTATLSDDSINADRSSNNNILADVGQSQIMQRRNSNTANANEDANETSFLKKRPNKKASEVKLDWSGYDELEGLATPMDVFEDFLERMEQIRRQDEIWAEQYRKFEAGEIDSFDDLNNDADLNSQNVEAPSWTVLFKNKLDTEL